MPFHADCILRRGNPEPRLLAADETFKAIHDDLRSWC